MESNLIDLVNQILRNWRQNHRHHGGLKAVARCLLGTARIHAAPPRDEARGEPPLVEALSFSVVPWLTVLWAVLLWRVMPSSREDGAAPCSRLLIGDCSGGFRHRHRAALGEAAVTVIPFLNQHHGTKLDLFLSRACRAPYVLISDDDVFWLSGEPWRWALRQLEEDPKVAVVSLWPRERTDGFADGIERPLMGSHGLVVRRDLWLREGLSFEVVRPRVIEPGQWFRDTGDEAHHRLVERGYRVLIAPPEIRRGLAGLDSLSASLLRWQKYSPSKLPAALDLPIKEDNTLRAILAARHLVEVLDELGSSPRRPKWIDAHRLDEAERILRPRMSEERQEAIQLQVEIVVDRIRDTLVLGRSSPYSTAS